MTDKSEGRPRLDIERGSGQVRAVNEINPVHGSLGAHRVRESFNPSKDNMVDKIKRYTADLIDLCEDLKHGVNPDVRLASLAQTAYEEAAMWAVKAATTDKS